MKKKTDSLLRSTSLFSLATLMSRVLGLVRESFIAAFVPGAWQGVFLAGLKIPSTFRQLFAEGSLSAAFIPLLAKVKEDEGEEAARVLANAVFTFLSLSVSIVVLLAIVFAPNFVPYLLDFPKDESWKIAAGVTVTQIMFPFLFFVAISAWAMGILNTHRYFFVPALASAFFNMSMIVGLAIGPFYFTDMSLMWWLGGAVIFGGMLQFASQIHQLRTIGYFPPRWENPLHPKVKRLLRMLAPSVFGLAVYQINALITQTYFASKFGADGIAQMTYAFRLIQFPLGVVGIALATASFPRIAQYIAQQRSADASKTLDDVLKYLILLMIPSAIGFMVIGEDIIGMIFNHGEFQREGWLEPTYGILAFYSLGLLSISSVTVLARTSQAHHNFSVPVACGTFSVLSNIILCYLFVNTGWEIWSLSLASAISSTINALMLLSFLRIRLMHIHLMQIVYFGLKVLLAAAIMGLACWGIRELLPSANERFLLFALRAAVGIAVSLLVYTASGYVLFRRELMAMVRRKG